MSLFSEEKAHPFLMSQACQARLGMTKRVQEGSITLDDYDSQSLEVARQLGTKSFLLGSTVQYTTVMCVILFGTIL